MYTTYYLLHICISQHQIIFMQSIKENMTITTFGMIFLTARREDSFALVLVVINICFCRIFLLRCLGLPMQYEKCCSYFDNILWLQLECCVGFFILNASFLHTWLLLLLVKLHYFILIYNNYMRILEFSTSKLC